MRKYHKIQTVFKRNGKTLLEGQYSLPEFEYLAGNQWTFTEKVDGTNIRILWEHGTVRFAGKTDNAQIHAGLVNCLREHFPDDSTFVSAFPDCDSDSGVCLYGEGYGAKIQKGGRKYSADQEFVLFDVKVGDCWLQRRDVEDVAAKLSIDVVPVIGQGTLAECVELVRGGFLSRWGDFEAEGVVARPTTELCTRSGQRIIAKLKCRDFR